MSEETQESVMSATKKAIIGAITTAVTVVHGLLPT